MISTDLCGVVLAGGWGTRLLPLTTSTNKHLLPVYDEPMIFKSLGCLQRIGIKNVMIVLGGHSGDAFFSMLGDGHRFGMEIRYAYQEQSGGIAEALRLTKNFVGDRSVAVILGDNIFSSDLSGHASEFLANNESCDCYLFVKRVENPEAFGIAWVDEKENILKLVEKPDKPDSNLAVTGLYFYSSAVYDLIDYSVKNIGYSERGELEITDINNLFVERGAAKAIYFDGFWADCGTHDALLEASVMMKNWQDGPWLKSK